MNLTYSDDGMRTAIIAIMLGAGFLSAGEPDVIVSARSDRDFPLTADSSAAHWKEEPAVIATNDARGTATPGHRTEIRSRWTDENLYLLFICAYEQLHLKPGPDTENETRELWNWDVAEVFIGAEFSDIHRYREFQVSPQGEFLDLDIDSQDLNADRDMKWDSGFEVRAHIDETNRIWYGEMKIPIRSIDERKPLAGNEFRVNFYRLQGPEPDRKQVAWRPTSARSHHVPEAFGRLILGE